MGDDSRRVKPTNSEIGILQVLWSKGPGTVREVHDELAKKREVGYTTVLKLMQIMLEKGSLIREEQIRGHVYRPAEPQDSAKRNLVGDLMDRAFGGSAHDLIMHALTAKQSTPEELADIRRLLDKLEKNGE
jgi:BlaI family penicillinase repressor